MWAFMAAHRNFLWGFGWVIAGGLGIFAFGSLQESQNARRGVRLEVSEKGLRVDRALNLDDSTKWREPIKWQSIDEFIAEGDEDSGIHVVIVRSDGERWDLEDAPRDVVDRCIEWLTDAARRFDCQEPDS